MHTKTLSIATPRPHQADYLGSTNLETITQGIRGELKRVTFDKYNVGTALLQIKECHLYRQQKRCHSFNSFIGVFADEVGRSPNTLYNWMKCADAVRKFPVYYQMFEVDPLEHFSKLPYLTLALKSSPKKLAETMEKFKSENVRGFLQYTRSLPPTKSLPKKKPSNYAPVVIRSMDLTPDEKAVFDIVSRGTIVVVLGVRGLAYKEQLEIFLENERNKAVEYGRRHREKHTIDPLNPFDISNLNMSLDEISDRIRHALKDEAYRTGAVAIGIFLIFNTPFLIDQIKQNGWASPSQYCETVFDQSPSSIYWYKRSGEAMVTYHDELVEHGFSAESGIYKLAFLDRALKGHSNRAIVFGALVRMSTAAFEEYALGTKGEDVREYGRNVKSRAEPYLNLIRLIKARNEIPAVFEVYFDWERDALYYLHSQFRDSEINAANLSQQRLIAQ